MSTLRYQKRGNKFYVYEVTQYWDKELKKPRQTTKYLGNTDVEGGEPVKTGRAAAKPREEKAIVDFGDSFAIHESAKAIGIEQVIRENFGDDADSIMALICYQMTEGSAMQHCDLWLEGNIAHHLFPKAKTSSQDISRLLKKIGQQQVQQKFFKQYVAKFFPEQTGVLIDSTSLPSAINSPINAYGYSSGQITENVSCLMLVDKTSKLPIYFRAMGGDISDNTTLETTLREIKQLGLKTESALLDAGYCSKANLELLCNENIDFVTRLPRSHKLFYDLIDQSKCEKKVDKAVQYGERMLFVDSLQLEIYGKTMWAHILLDPHKEAKEMKMILRDELESAHTEEEAEKLNSKLKYSGYFILLSRSEIESKEILPTYYMRQNIEQIFGFAKSNNSLLPLRVHSETSINGYLMLAFLSLIVFISMRKNLDNTSTVDQSLLALRALKAKIFDTEIIIQEPNKKIKDLAKALNIIMPKFMGI